LKAVLNASSFSGVVMKVDGVEVKHLHESIVNDFSPGVVLPGSEGQVFFTGPSNPLPAGTVLYQSGTEGYYVILQNLSPGEHVISTQYTFIVPYSGCPFPGVFRGTLGNHQRHRVSLNATWLTAGGIRDAACRLRSAVAPDQIGLPMAAGPLRVYD
jgi:hypothetical protein